VSYVEAEDRLKVQVGADKAMHAKTTIDRMLEDARNRVASVSEAWCRLVAGCMQCGQDVCSEHTCVCFDSYTHVTA
jgi:hypothetical protein